MRPILLVRDREGFIEAFANLVPEFQAKEIAVDLMRYRSESESGLMDFLFVSLFQWAREQGYDTFIWAGVVIYAYGGLKGDSRVLQFFILG
ncbi:MAG TPA: phosphatidylglycerol lysyltransferase domain-containing protein, partial [Anaerolineales bacterium]|nr:phosphatidylglycerol lysyltransferase domain-containing protein [Anaerolineales bacterium]